MKWAPSIISLPAMTGGESREVLLFTLVERNRVPHSQSRESGGYYTQLLSPQDEKYPMRI